MELIYVSLDKKLDVFFMKKSRITKYTGMKGESMKKQYYLKERETRMLEHCLTSIPLL